MKGWLCRYSNWVAFFILIVCSQHLFAQKKTKIEILNSDAFKINKAIAPDAYRLVGNVKFKQDSTVMTCDSAYLYESTNKFEAYSNVHLYKINDDNVNITSEYLQHNGNTKTAHFRYNVVLRDTQVVLTTDSLDYNIEEDIGYYQYGGKIVDSATTLTSVKGYYYNALNTVYFKDDVVINHNEGEYQLYSDTIEYNTVSEIAFFHGPTNIVNDTNNMYSEYGWYNTQNNTSLLQKNALYTNPNQSLEADSIYLDREAGISIGYSNVIATDSLEKIIIKGNYLKAIKDPEEIFVTDSALLIHVLDDDSVFIHADTLQTYYDTSGQYRQMFAYRHVKMFKSDFQSKCDSMYISLEDSVLQFHGEPIMWAEGSQITAEYIEAFIVNEVLDRFKLYKSGIIISMQDSSHFNQVKGAEITGFFKNNELYKLDVHKNSETIYFPVSDDEIIGVNKSDAKDLLIYMKDGQMHRLIYKSKPNHKLYPIEDLTQKEMQVTGFKWLENKRPKSSREVFIWEEGKSEENIKQ
jgi:lipopolysaccharide export system protein LptA